MGRLLLIRHGHSEGNALGVFQGQTEYPLSKQGCAEATAVAKRLAVEEQNVETLVSSPLGRAHQTAEAIAGSVGHPIQVIDGLKERDVGAAAGLTDDQVRGRFPNWRRDGFPGQEAEPDLSARVRGVANELLKVDGTVIAVSHAGFIRNLCHQIVGARPQTPSRFLVTNCSITEVTIDRQGRFVLHRFNDASHLRNAPQAWMC